MSLSRYFCFSLLSPQRVLIMREKSVMCTLLPCSISSLATHAAANDFPTPTEPYRSSPQPPLYISEKLSQYLCMVCIRGAVSSSALAKFQLISLASGKHSDLSTRSICRRSNSALSRSLLAISSASQRQGIPGIFSSPRKMILCCLGV